MDGVEGPDLVIDILRSKLSGFFDISEKTRMDFRDICGQPVRVAAGTAIVRNGEDYPGMYLIQEGWALRSRFLPEGTRQIVNTAMPGDVLCLNALLFDSSDFDISAKTDLLLYPIDPEHLREVFTKDPNLAAALLWVSAHEESILAERIVSLGRRSARMRTAHVLAEILSRMALVDELGERLLDLPLTQEDLSDILGISVVYTNKTLRALQREQVISFSKGRLTVHDRARLEHIAGFDAGYLHFTQIKSRPTRLDTV
ncbi:MAG: Crp/Fnr family transcriptional regulator [Pseudomonadota bacterium]